MKEQTKDVRGELFSYVFERAEIEVVCMENETYHELVEKSTGLVRYRSEGDVARLLYIRLTHDSVLVQSQTTCV